MQDEQKQQHQVRYVTALAKLRSIAEKEGVNSKAAVDLAKLKKAMEDYITAKTDWSLNNTDQTMIHLVGKWARMSKLLREMGEKYV